MAAKGLIYEFDSVLADAYRESTMQNKLISDMRSQFYKCMDLARHDPTKLQVLLSSMISIEHELYNMGNELANNMGNELASDTTMDIHTYFGCAVPQHIKIHPPPTFVTQGREKWMREGVEKVVEQQSYMWMCHCCNQVCSHHIRNCRERRC